MMLNSDPSAIEVFEKWKNAPANAFGSKNNAGVIPEDDKDRYRLIFDELIVAAEGTRSSFSDPKRLEIKKINFSHQYGARGHRPVDMWVSLCAKGSDEFGLMPQVYAIISERGLEIGLAVSINENDYHDISVKARNKTIVPLINQRLPLPGSSFAESVEAGLSLGGDWVYNGKARLVPGDQGFSRWKDLNSFLKDIKSISDVTGGGSISKLFESSMLANIDLQRELSNALEVFHPILFACLPNSWETELVKCQIETEKVSNEIAFDPTDVEDARAIMLRQIAQRRGQKKFRTKLFEAYEGKCALSGTAVEAVLEAAHITPYLGEATNHISNGILLRSDLHTLFDLKLFKINPESLRAEFSPVLDGTPYWDYNDRLIFVPKALGKRPSVKALGSHYNI